jgi:hypothetical protein
MVAVAPMQQAAASLMQELGSFLRHVWHLEIPHVYGIHGRQVRTAIVLQAGSDPLAVRLSRDLPLQ